MSKSQVHSEPRKKRANSMRLIKLENLWFGVFAFLAPNLLFRSFWDDSEDQIQQNFVMPYRSFPRTLLPFSHENTENFCIFLLLLFTTLIDFRGVFPMPTIYEWEIDRMRGVYGTRNRLGLRIILRA